MVGLIWNQYRDEKVELKRKEEILVRQLALKDKEEFINRADVRRMREMLEGGNIKDLDEEDASPGIGNALQCKARTGGPDQVEVLLSSRMPKANPNYIGNTGTPLHNAVAGNKPENIRVLMEHRVDKSIQFNGQTAEEYAHHLGPGHSECVLVIQRNETRVMRDERLIREEAAKVERLIRETEVLAVRVNDALTSSGDPVEIPFDVLKLWTSDFSNDGKIGEGGFGDVYEGTIRYERSSLDYPLAGEAKKVAIKRVNFPMLSRLTQQRDSSASASDNLSSEIRDMVHREINVLANFKKCKNLINLIGYCAVGASSPDQYCLVYEIAPEGDLLRVLQDRPRELHWKHRLRIAVEIATGLNFLHNSNPGHPAIHRDIKAANILLFSDFKAKITDCGLSKFVPDGLGGGVGVGMSVGFSGVKRFGTMEYMCPEYIKNTALVADAKCDIYSFGLVLLELLSGKLHGINDLFLDSDIDGLEVDRAVADEWPSECVFDIKSLASECVDKRSKRIDSMNKVLERLTNIYAKHWRPDPARSSR